MAGGFWLRVNLAWEKHDAAATTALLRSGGPVGFVRRQGSVRYAELVQWGVIKKAWVPGERRDHYEAETSIWKMVSLPEISVQRSCSSIASAAPASLSG